jgi:threonine synthase
VIVPRDTPPAAVAEALMAGARVFTVDGTIATAGAVVGRVAPRIGWFDLSTLKEPYRLEGKKTMGLELAEQLGWSMPDVIVYPTGGGTGLIGIAKADEELRALGWLRGAPPRFVAVQAEGCAPVVRAWREGAETTTPWEDPVTEAPGLRVPSPFAGRQMLAVLRATGGEAIAVSEAAIREAQRRLAHLEGLWTAPEAAATVAALATMTERGDRLGDARIVLVLTGSGLKNAPPSLPAPVHLAGPAERVVDEVRRILDGEPPVIGSGPPQRASAGGGA